MKENKKVYILGTGAQAPYGKGEIIDIVPFAHYRKIQRICGKFYTSPTLRLGGKEGPVLDWTYDGMTVTGLEEI